MKLLFSALACLLSMSAYCQNEYSIEFISGDFEKQKSDLDSWVAAIKKSSEAD